ncbi:hypothetical protein [Streptomyces aquilus]|uniref:hypothetical protein n=1 Tax=Streptomyces aquilus TaxID=2548456 RepID=UPI00368B9494
MHRPGESTDARRILVLRHDGSVPRDLTYRPGPGEPARIDVSDRDTRQGVAVDCRYDVSPDGT